MTDTPFRDPKTPLAPEQLELRKRVLKQIEYELASFDMRSWEKIIPGWGNQHGRESCKTTRCLAGWAQFLARGAVFEYGTDDRRIVPVDDDAIALLGLTADEYGTDDLSDEGNALFYLSDDDALARMRELAQAEAG